MIALALFGCSESGNWVLETPPTDKLKTQAMLKVPEGLLVAGRTRDGIEVFKRDAHGTYTSVLKKDAGLKVYDLHQEPQGPVWLTVGQSTGKPDSAHYLYRSDDQGDTWQPVNWFTVWIDQILTAPDGSLWLRGGEDELFRSTDAGRTFACLETPWKSVALGEQLFVDGDTVLFAGKSMHYRTTDGITWTTTPTDVHIQWMDAHYVGGERDGRPVFAKRGEPFKQVFSGLGEVLTASSNGEEVWMLAEWHSGKLSSGGKLLVSYDGGDTWARDSSVSLYSLDPGWHLEADGTLYSSTIYHPDSIWVRTP